MSKVAPNNIIATTTSDLLNSADMKPVVAIIAAIVPVASARRPRRLQNSMSMDPGLPLTDLPIPRCSCSPRDFTFQLQLDRDCDTNTINGSPGVEIAVCNRRGGVGVTDFSTLEIVDIQWLELNGLTVINQNDTFTNTSLVSGDTFSFPSISGLLDPDLPIEEQAQYYPTEVTLSLEGKVKDDDGNEVTVRNQVAWRYTEDCNSLPISVGQSIGWVDIVSRTHPLLFYVFHYECAD